MSNLRIAAVLPFLLLPVSGQAMTAHAAALQGTAVSDVAPMANPDVTASVFYLPPTATWETSATPSTAQIDVFFTGSNGHVFHKFWQPGGTWQGWFDIGGALISGPAAVWSRNDTQLDIVGIGTDNRVWHKWFTWQNGWSGWVSIGGQAISGVGATWSPDGQFHVVATGTDNAVWHDWWVPGQGWQGWHSLGGAVVGSPTASSTFTGSSTSDEEFDAFATGANHQVYRDSWTPSNGWSGWGSLGGNVITSPSGTWTPTNQALSVLAVGADDAVWDRRWEAPTGWQGWSSWGGTAASAPAATYRDDLERLDIFVFGTDGNVWQINSDGGGWSRI